MNARSRASGSAKKAPLKLSLRAFLEDAAFCNLELSPVVAAIADAAQGIPIDLDDATSKAVFGCAPSSLPTVPRRTVDISAGGRSGKSSRLGAPAALYLAYTVPLPNLRASERGRSVLVAPDRDLAEQDLDYVRGYAESSPVLSRMLIPSTKDRVTIRRPWDGAAVDIRVGAANRGGKVARGRSLVGLVLDEADFFMADSSAAVTAKVIYQAALLRLVEGGQIWILSTPWIEGEGLLEEHIKRDHGRHEQSLVVARVPTKMLRPDFDPTGEIEGAMRADDPENADREIGAIPLVAGTEVFFDPVAVTQAFERPAFEGQRVGVGVGFDAGLVQDCTAAVAADKYPGAGPGAEGFDASDAYERRPKRGEPLKPSEAFGGAADFALGVGARSMAADSHYKESVREHVTAKGVELVDAPEGAEGKVTTYLAARKVMQDGRLRVSIADPGLRARLKAQLRSITKKPLTGGGIQISAPRKKASPSGAGGGHGDLVSALVLALWRAGAGRAARAAGAGCKVIGAAPTRGRLRHRGRRGGAEPTIAPSLSDPSAASAAEESNT